MRHRTQHSRILRLSLVTACIGVLGLAGLAGSANAATQLGQVGVEDPSLGGCTHCALMQVATDPSVTYAMPSDGVITSWRFRAVAKPGTAHLRIYRPAATPGQFQLMAWTADHTFALHEEATVPVRVPVKAGDRLGIGTNGPPGMFYTADLANQLGGVPFYAPMGSISTPNTSGGARVAIAATLEPDADKDGFGDESQDGCPSDPTSHAACAGSAPPPTAPPPSSAPPAVDSSAPILALAAPRRESVKHGSLHVYAKSNEAAVGVVTGRVRIGRSAKSYRLRHASPSLAAGSRTKMVVRIPKRTMLAIRAALRAGHSPNARLTVLARDVAGNATKAVKKIQLVR
jgi:hypothetical protein